MNYIKYITISLFILTFTGCLDRAESMIIEKDDCTVLGCEANEVCNTNSGLCEIIETCMKHEDCANGKFCGIDLECHDGCFNDNQCDNEICNLTTHKCEAIKKCSNHNECRNGEYCDDNGICRLGCVEDKDCEEKMICNLEQHKCEKPECTNHNECKNGEFCDKDLKCKPGCVEDKDCNNEQLCEKMSHTCIKKHCEMTGCPSGKVCNIETGLCDESFECLSNDDCSGGKKCNPETRTCERNFCNTTADCLPRMECKEHECKIKSNCDSDADCNGLKCTLGFCSGCETNEDCPENQECKKPFPGVSYCEGSGGTGGCITNSQCDEDKVCDIQSGQCHYADGHCDVDDDCRDELTCQSLGGQKICRGCAAPEDCFMGQMCMFEMCISGGGCESNEDCMIPGQICFQGSCIGGPTP